MNQSDRTLAYHLQAVKTLLDLVGPPQATESLGGVGGTRQQQWDDLLGLYPGKVIHTAWDEYDPNRQAERVELRCPVCGQRNCPLDVRRGM